MKVTNNYRINLNPTQNQSLFKTTQMKIHNMMIVHKI